MKLHREARKTFWYIAAISVLLVVLTSLVLWLYFSVSNTYEDSLAHERVWEEISKNVNYVASEQFAESGSDAVHGQVQENLVSLLANEQDLREKIDTDMQFALKFVFPFILEDGELDLLGNASVDPEYHTQISYLADMPSRMFPIGTRHWNAATHIAVKSGRIYEPVSQRTSLLLELLHKSVRAIWFFLLVTGLVYLVAIYLIWKRQLGKALDEIELAQAELEEQKNTQQMILDNVPAAITCVDDQRRFVFTNNKYNSLLGFPGNSNLVGESIPSITGEANWNKISPNIERAIGGETVEYEVQIDTPRGQRSVNAKYVPLTIQGEESNRVITLLMDVTRQKRMEGELRKNEEYLRLTLTSIGDAVIATDRENRIVTMNPIAEQMTGVLIEDARGRMIGSIFKLQNLDIESLVKARLNYPPVDNASHEDRLESNTGREYLINATISPIISDTGTTEGTVLVFRDLTNERVLQKQAAHSEKMQALGVLAGGIAHDFNNMLGGILGATELIIDSESDRMSPASLDLLRLLVRTTEQASDLTGKLTRFSRTDDNFSEKVDLLQVVDDAIHFIRRSMDKRVEIITELGAKQTVINGNAGGLQAAFLNVMLNATQSMPEGGKLTVRSSNLRIDARAPAALGKELASGDYIELNFEDTGIGIPSTNLDKIFQPFFTTKEKGRGTGLGLSAVYGTIISHSGTITVESKEGEGTRVKITLPLTQSEMDSQITESPELSLSIGTECVLYIDDDKLLLEVTRGYLEKLGFKVMTADNAREGIQQYKANSDQISAVLLDINMPEINGIDAMRMIREFDEEARVILVTGFVDNEIYERVAQRNDTVIIKKPFNYETLRSLFQVS